VTLAYELESDPEPEIRACATKTAFYLYVIQGHTGQAENIAMMDLGCQYIRNAISCVAVRSLRPERDEH
jgi:hypothetical protein